MSKSKKNSPTASFLNARRLEENAANRAKLPNCKLSKCRLVGGKCGESGKTPQPQAFLMHADWRKMWRIGQKAPTSSFLNTGRLGENVKIEKNSPTASFLNASRLGNFSSYCNSFKLANRYPSAFRFAITFSSAPAFDDDTLCIRMIAPL